MSSKIILGMVALIFIVIGVVPLVVKKQVGDLRPAILPPKQLETITSEGEAPSAGEPVKLPIKAPNGFNIGVFAKGLKAPRDLEFSPGGVLLASIPSEGKVVALPDRNNDGITDETKEILVNLNRPHGIAFYEGKLYAAEEDRVTVYDWIETNLEPSNQAELFKLPKGGRHFTRTIAFNKSSQILISIGSTCDVCTEKDPKNGSVMITDTDGGNPRVYAKGLRNSVFITTNPATGVVWGTEMGRDFLGDSLPPDEINIIKEGDFGWPNCFGDKIHDNKFDKNTYVRDPCLDTISPAFEIPAHSAPLGLTFINSSQFPAQWQGDLLVSYHGSWNSSVPVGYKVVRMDVEGNTIKGAKDFITGFLNGSEALARPVDLIFDKMGSLYISDDKAGYIFKITKGSL